MTKKILALLLALVMVLSMTACGSDAEPPKGVITPNEDTTTAGETEAPSADTGSADAGSADTGSEDAGDSFSLGTMQGGTYENAYAGFGCRLDETWVYKTAQELQDVSGMTQEMFEGSDLDLSAYSQILDMMAECADPMATINVQYTALSAQERLAHAVAGEEGIIDATLEQMDLLVSTYAQAGIDVSSMEKVKVTFCGQERWAIKTDASIQGTGYYILQLFNTNIGPYYVTLTIGTFVDDNTTQLLDLFYSVS